MTSISSPIQVSSSIIDDEALELGRVLDPVLRLAEDDAQHALVLAQFQRGLAVVGLEFSAIAACRARPGVGLGDDGGPVEGRLGLLIGHLEEEQVGQLLDVVAVADAVVPQDVTVIPQALDNGCGWCIHTRLLII